MGTDVHGWIDAREPGFERAPWVGAVELGRLLVQNYDLFGCLFGVQNHGQFRPLFPVRDLPAGTRVQLPDKPENPTWALFTELQDVDVDEEADDSDERIHEFEVQENGTVKFVNKSSYSKRVEPFYERLKVETEVRDGQNVYRRVKLRRRDAMSDRWQMVMRIMSVLAETYQPENVRIVVWFDS